MKILLITHLCYLVLALSYGLSIGDGRVFSGSARLSASHLDTEQRDPKTDQSTRQGPPFTYPKFDEYGDLPFTQEKKRLDYFAEELRSVADEPGYIIEYRKKGNRQRRLTRAKRAKDYLVRVKNINAERITIVDGGYMKEFKIELRVGPNTPK